MLFTALSVSAITFEENGFTFELDVKNRTARVIGPTRLPQNGIITIPSIAKYQNQDIPVTELGEHLTTGCVTFSGNNKIIKVIIPNSIKFINWNAFSECKNLKEVKFSDELKEIRGNAFYGCVSLSSISLPQTLERIGDQAFMGCIAVPEIEIPSSVKSLGYNAFSDCYALEKVIISDSKYSLKIDTGTFAQCGAIKEIYIGRNINSSSSIVNCVRGAFSKLEEIQLGVDVTSIIFNTNGIYNLHKIKCDNPVPPDARFGDSSKLEQDEFFVKVKILVPKGSLAAYKADRFWSQFWNIEEI